MDINAFVKKATGNKKILALAILVCIYISFHKWFERQISDKLIEVFIKDFSVSLFTDILVFFLFLYSVASFARAVKRKFRPSLALVCSITAISFFYGFYRFTESVWVFYGLSILPIIKYGDLIFVGACFHVILYAVSSLQPRTLPPIKKDGFEVDEPLNPGMIDSLGRTNVAKKIVEYIENTRKDSSFCIGIVGNWGAGKTSFLNIIGEHVDCSRTITIRFNPWSSKHSESIMNDFLVVLSEELGKYDGTIGEKLNDYSKKLSEVDDNVFTRILKTFDGFLSDGTLSEKKKVINETIAKLGKQIIVFIDDVDRLDKSEVVEVIRLIRNTANFQSTFFIVAYDRNYVIKAIKGITDHDSSFFLEKIFQLEIPLPEYESKKIIEKLLTLLNSRIPIERRGELEQVIKGPRYGYETLIHSLIQNLRDVSRFTNSFSLSFEMLEGEILIPDLINIECLRVKYPSVYSLLYDKRNELFKSNSQNSANSSIYYSLKQLGANSQTVLESILLNFHDSYGVGLSEIEEVVASVKLIFSGDYFMASEKENSRLSIRTPTGFSRYFAQRLMQGELSENEFLKFRKQKSEIFNAQISEWVKSDLRWELRHRIESITEFNDREDFEKIVAGIFFLGNIPKGNSIGDYQGFSDEKLLYILNDFNGKIHNRFYNSDKDAYRSFLFSIFKSTNPIGWAQRSFISFLIKNNDHGLPLATDELVQINIDALNQQINKIQGFDQFDWDYWHNCTVRKEIPNGGNSFTLVDTKPLSAQKLMREFVERSLDSFIVAMIDKTEPDLNVFKISAAIDVIYDSFDDFEKFINEVEVGKSKYLKEFKEFYADSKKNGFRPTKFNFKTIEIYDRWK